MVLNAGAITDDDRAAFETFASFQPDADVTVRCASLSDVPPGSRSRRGSCPARRWGWPSASALTRRGQAHERDVNETGHGRYRHAPPSLPKLGYRTRPRSRTRAGIRAAQRVGVLRDFFRPPCAARRPRRLPGHSDASERHRLKTVRRLHSRVTLSTRPSAPAKRRDDVQRKRGKK